MILKSDFFWEIGFPYRSVLLLYTIDPFPKYHFKFYFTLYVVKRDSVPRISDTDDLKEQGVLIFISDDKMGMGQRMKVIADSKLFGKSKFEHSLNLWEPDEDVSLYLFRQPIDDWARFLEQAPTIMENMLKTLEEKTYFVLYFSDFEWQKYQIRLLKYVFFQNAKTKMIPS